MKILNFEHNSEKGTIVFEVELNGAVNKVEIEKTDRGVSYNDIDEFTSDYTDAQYNQLDEFIDGCAGILHQFYHG